MTTTTPAIFALDNSHLSYEIAQKIQKNPKKTFCIIHETNAQTQQLFTETQLFLPPEERARTLWLPDWETLPYDQINAHRNIVSHRIQTLYQLTQTTAPILFVSLQALCYQLPPRSFILQECLLCEVGKKLSVQDFRSLMLAKGYHETPTVQDIGQFSIRGSILDVILTAKKAGSYRIELFDDEIDSIRKLDIATNRSHSPISAIQIQPHQEFNRLEKKAFEQIPAYQNCPAALKSKLLALLTKPERIDGINYYLPYFHMQLDTLGQYLPKQTNWIGPSQLCTLVTNFQTQVHTAYQRQIEQNRPVAHPSTVVCPTVCTALTQVFDICPEQVKSASKLPRLHDAATTVEQNPAVQTLINKYEKTIIYAPTQQRSENLKHCLLHMQHDQAHGKIQIAVGQLRSGFICHQSKTAHVSENILLGRILDFEQNTTPVRRSIEEIENWSVGTLLVHRDYGIGRFQEMKSMTLNDVAEDFLVLAYAGDDKLYVATSQFHLLSRYIGSNVKNKALSRLDGKKWKKKKEKAYQNADLLAEKLLQQHALRQQSTAPCLSVRTEDMAQFCEYFPYTETPDQKKAIHEITENLKQKQVMNRLLCGDVGFGKTEVAMRAAFIAAFSGYQVALLVPTTLLAKQHFQTFQDRFSHFPIQIALMTRLTGSAQRDIDKQKLSTGAIDIVIATHGLLQPDIQFKNLALMIIDEEHKFGVKQKELMKAMSSQAHTLAMSATPIPRTLHMTMAKLRDLSIIATPPKNRQSVRTFVHVYQDSIVQEAILRETQRGGQCYVIHNDIRTLEIVKEKINALLPTVRCAVMHAKQNKTKLETTMLQFQQGHFDVLLATTIVESGIDIANANTIILLRADLLGLSQLHQLRGRVGRSHQQAYAYMLTPSHAEMTADGRARMSSIHKQSTLGSGLNIAIEDLEIRGAGDLLGKKQSGTADEIGLSLYNDILAKATRQLLGETEQESSAQIDIKLNIDLSIPKQYIQDFSQRLSYYRAISCAEQSLTLKKIRHEMEDCYGLLPNSVIALLQVREVKQYAAKYNIKSIQATNFAKIILLFAATHDLHRILAQTALNQHPIRVVGLKVYITCKDLADLLNAFKPTKTSVQVEKTNKKNQTRTN